MDNFVSLADDTKIWRTIRSENDHELLQKDIEYLNNWALANKMNFHPQKCKVVSVAHSPPPLLGILPNIQYFYSLGDSPLDYVDSEKDLGVHINTTLNFNDQCNKLLSKANQRFGLTRRTCHFVNDVKRRRALYLALIRSQFEHCSPIWRPNSTTLLNKHENFQKKCIKWVLSEEYISYSSHGTYLKKCRQVNLLPLVERLKLNDLILFHKVIHKLIPLELPDYLSFFDGNSRLRSCHLDILSLVCHLQTKKINCYDLNKSFFFRTHTLWNSIPFEIRQINVPSAFKNEVIRHLWKLILMDINERDDCYLEEEDSLSDID